VARPHRLDAEDSLSKPSTVDVLQLRCVAAERFVRRIGSASIATMDEIVAALAAVVEFR
jgi:mRNA interferase MazF